MAIIQFVEKIIVIVKLIIELGLIQAFKKILYDVLIHNK